MNKVGEKNPPTKVIAGLISELDDIITRLTAICITLSPEDRKRLLHPRKGAEREMQRVHDLATKHEVDVKGIPLDGMNEDLQLARQLQPLEDKLRSALTLVEDTGAQADSEAWEAFLTYYAVLSSMAPRIPELAVELAPVIEFMSNKRRKVPQAPTE